MKIIRILLFPITILYDIITTIRNYLFTKGKLKSTSFDIPVIAVGNLSVGGTGKSPQIEYLIRLLKDTYRVAVLSRGYKRKTKGFQIVNDKHTSRDVGDEPLQFFKKFDDITVAVDANRTNGIQQLLKQKNPPEIVLLDDAFQHRKVQASFYVLLTKYNDLYVHDFILPTGNLRESRRGAKRADVIVVTKCPENLSEAEQQKIIKKLKPKAHQQVFFTSIVYDDDLKGSETIPLHEIQNKEVVLVTGIANPNPLLTYLTEIKKNFRYVKFPDHHDFSDADISKIKEAFKELPSKEKIIITTEKDYVRLKGRLEKLSYIEIENHFLKDENDFKNLIKNTIKK